ncbi:MAG: bacillithiol biosynthesis deacetylase BshB1 [Acidobacteriota bacterium]|nr:bacillithiol biosynthesis deacetylase BshB1 [Acidobacteriota bacterium]
MFEPRPVDVLAVGAHPDDVELGCGGTLLRLKSLGRRTGVVDLTRGELGTRGTMETRALESRRAAALLGLDFRLNLGLRDGNLSPDEESRLALIRVIRKCRPKLVLTHSKWGHPDHGKASILVEEAVHHAGLAAIDTSQQRFRPRRIACWTHFDEPVVPHVGVDISDHYEQKEHALKAFASQLHRPDSREPATYLSDPTFLERIRSFHMHVGSLVGCSLAEGFLMARPPRIGDLADC